MKVIKEIFTQIPLISFETKTEAALWNKLRENDQIFDAWYPGAFDVLSEFLESLKYQVEKNKPEGINIKKIEKDLNLFGKDLKFIVFCFYKNNLPLAVFSIEKNTKAIFVTAVKKNNSIFQESFFKAHKPEGYTNVPMLLSAFQIEDESNQILKFQSHFLDKPLEVSLSKPEIQMELVTDYLKEITVKQGWEFNFSYATVRIFFTEILANLKYTVSKDPSTKEGLSIIASRKIEKSKFAIIKNDNLMAWGTIALVPGSENLVKLVVIFNKDFNNKVSETS